MSNKQLYLKEDAYFEPLFNGWYAWPYLMPPATAARHTVHTHLRIMKSFVNNHQLHMLATKETTLAGGEFLDGTDEDVAVIKQHISRIENELSDVVELSQALTDLEELLRQHTSGKTIDPLYAQMPELLKGYVELFLDSEHRASYRLIEPLLYRSNLYKRELQSVSFGLLSKVGERPFVLSTPRLADDNHLHLAVDYNHPALNKILMSREVPISEEELDSLFAELPITGGLNYRELFTETPTDHPRQALAENTIRLVYTGHAGFLVEANDVTILVDPYIANRGADYADDICSYSEIPERIDYICLTHNHQDHVSLETLLQLRYKTENILVPKNNGGSLMDPSIRLLLKQLNFNVIEVDDLDVINAGNVKITAIPFLGEHGDLNIRSKTGWLIEIADKKMYFGADSSNPDEHLYQHLSELLQGVDVFAIGMECVGAPYTWLYGALHTKLVPKAIKESRRLNGSDYLQAEKMVDLIKPEQVFIYALGREPWYKYFMGIEYSDDSDQIVESNKLLAYCTECSIPAKSLYAKEVINISLINE